MKKIVLFVGILAFLPLTAQAQLYNDKYDALVSGVDRAASDAATTYSNVESAGAQEEALSPSEHYDLLTQPTNEANDRHFDVGSNITTIIETENNQK